MHFPGVMSTGLYVSYTGASAEMADLETIANNIANASTAGYLRDRTQFDTVLGASMPFVQTSSASIDLRPGTPRLTRNPLHGALDGDGFFAVEGPGGEELYTRRGDFRLNGEGRLVLPNGYPVIGESSALILPPGSDASLRADGSLATADGAFGRLRMVRFEEPGALSKLGEGLVRAGEGALLEPYAGRLSVGFVETSNVNLSAEMVALIQTARSFEAAMQSMRINDQLTQTLIESSNG